MDSFTIEAFTLLGTGIFIIGLRLFARITAVGIKNLALDDYLMCLAAVSLSSPLLLSRPAGWPSAAVPANLSTVKTAVMSDFRIA